MYNTKRKPNDDEGGQAGGPAAFPRAREEDIAALRAIARAGGGKHHVAAKGVTPAQLRRLRIEGYVELLEEVSGRLTARLTVHALQALAAAPGAMAR